MDPVGGTVGGAGEAITVGERFEEQGAIAVTSRPVGGELAGSQGEDAGGQIAYRNPGQYQEARVVDDQVQAGLALVGGPANEVVAGRGLPGCGTEAQHPQQDAVTVDEVAQLRAGEGVEAQVVILRDEIVPAARGYGVADEVEGETGEVAAGAGERGARGRGAAGDGGGTCVFMLRLGQGDQAVTVHAQQRDAAGHVFESAVGLEPVELGADRPGEGGTRSCGACQLADAVELAVGEVPAAIGDGQRRRLLIMVASHRACLPPAMLARAARVPAARGPVGGCVALSLTLPDGAAIDPGGVRLGCPGFSAERQGPCGASPRSSLGAACGSMAEGSALSGCASGPVSVGASAAGGSPGSAGAADGSSLQSHGKNRSQSAGKADRPFHVEFVRHILGHFDSRCAALLAPLPLLRNVICHVDDRQAFVPVALPSMALRTAPLPTRAPFPRIPACLLLLFGPPSESGADMLPDRRPQLAHLFLALRHSLLQRRPFLCPTLALPPIFHPLPTVGSPHPPQYTPQPLGFPFSTT